jgi:Fe-S cluster biogenesis protein NfuA/nitrite reductase/ring-hydroxylating ferredoxin subunit
MSRREIQELSERIDTLLDEVERRTEPDVAARVEDLVRAVVSLYGAGLGRLVGRLMERPDGEEVLRDLLTDDLVAGLMLLHDLHPDDPAVRIQQALDRVRPYLGSHAGGIDYLGLDDDGVVRLRLQGSCDGCPGSTATVRLTVEQAVLDAAPEAVAVDVEGMVTETGPKLITIPPFQPHSGSDGWHPLPAKTPPGRLDRLDVAGLDVLVTNLDGTLYAYRNSCPACASALHTGAVDGETLTCPGCPATYSVRLAGRAHQTGNGPLEPLPVLPDGAGWKVAVPGRQPV